jgi:hypothetical protein
MEHFECHTLRSPLPIVKVSLEPALELGLWRQLTCRQGSTLVLIVFNDPSPSDRSPVPKIRFKASNLH